VSAIYLVRHGQAAFGTDDYDRLTPLGAEQCAALARHWRSLERPAPIVFAGTMRRHRQSTRPSGNGWPICSDRAPCSWPPARMTERKHSSRKRTEFCGNAFLIF
jgi:phosphohistidine phosphatase SixA